MPDFIGTPPLTLEEYAAGPGAPFANDEGQLGVGYQAYLRTQPYYGPGHALTDELRASLSADLDALGGAQPLTELERERILSLPVEAWDITLERGFLNWVLKGMVNSTFDPINQPDTGNPRDQWALLLNQVIQNHVGLMDGRPISDLFQPVQNLAGANAALLIVGGFAAFAGVGEGIGAGVAASDSAAAAAAAAADAVDASATTIGAGVAESGAAAGAAAAGAAGAVGADIGSAAASSGAAAAGASAAAGSAVSSTLSDIIAGVRDLISPIADTVHSISSVVQEINENLIKPIVGPITSILENYRALSNSLQADLHSGITGLLKIPSDIAGALTTVDASFQRAIAQLGAANEAVIQRQLGPGVASGLSAAFAGVEAQVNGGLDKGLADERDAMVDHINEDPELEDIQHMLERITAWLSEESGWFGMIAGKIVDFLTSSTLIFSYLEAKQHFYHQVGNLKWPTTLLTSGELLEAYRREVMEGGLVFDQLKRLGYSEERVQVLTELARKLPSESDAFGWAARGLIDADQVLALLTMNGWREDDARRLVVAAKLLPDTPTAISWYRRGLMGEEELRQVIAATNLRPEDIDRAIAGSSQLSGLEDIMRALDRTAASRSGVADSALGSVAPDELEAAARHLNLTVSALTTAWRNHWQLLPPPLAVVAYFRGYINLPQLQGLLCAAAIPSELQSVYIDLQRPLPSLRNIPAMLKAGVLNAAEAQAKLQQLGFSLADSDHIIQLALHKTAAVGNANGEELHGLTVAAVGQLYDAGTITADRASALFSRLGMGAEAVTLTLALHDLRRDAAERRAIAEHIIAQARAGHIEHDEAQAQLHAANLTTAEVERYLAQLERATQTRAKLPSEAQVMQMLKHEVIDRAEAARTLGLIGYSDLWTERLIQLEEGRERAAAAAG